MFSIICVYNDEEVFKGCLRKSLQGQTAGFELIDLDNRKGVFKSAAEALNYGGAKAGGKYLMFAHQDVELSSSRWLEETEAMLDTLPRLGIAGVAGVSRLKYGVRAAGHLTYGAPIKKFSEIELNKPAGVQTVDECLFMIPNAIFKIFQLDGKIFDGWHLYAVDYCLAVKKAGYEVYVVPAPTYHRSPGIEQKGVLRTILDIGPYSKEYYSSVRKLLKKYNGYPGWICTTCACWHAFYPMVLQKLLNLAMYGQGLLKNLIRKKT